MRAFMASLTQNEMESVRAGLNFEESAVTSPV